MGGNAYVGVARLALHPAFRWSDAELHCPHCDYITSRAADWDQHYLQHNPTPEQAWRYLYGSVAWEVQAARQPAAWPVGYFTADGQPTSPAAGRPLYGHAPTSRRVQRRDGPRRVYDSVVSCACGQSFRGTDRLGARRAWERHVRQVAAHRGRAG
jgi:hypothetical protein